MCSRHESTGIDGDLGHLCGNLRHVESARPALVARERLEAGRRQQDRLPRRDVSPAGVVCWEGCKEGWPKLTPIAPSSRRFINNQVVVSSISESGDAGHARDVRRRHPPFIDEARQMQQPGRSAMRRFPGQYRWTHRLDARPHVIPVHVACPLCEPVERAVRRIVRASGA